MKILGLHHTSLLVADLERSLAFYLHTLGFTQDSSRPEMSFDGAWLKAGDQQLHLLELPNPDPLAGRPPHAGRDRHSAFYIDDIDDLVQTLEAQTVPYTLSRSGRRALFCRDPDGNGLEFIEVK
jgi:glyoxylase I family protein